MKKILTSMILLVAMTTMFMSCTPEEEQSPAAPSPVGCWKGERVGLFGSPEMVTLNFTSSTLSVTWGNGDVTRYGYTLSKYQSQNGEWWFTTEDEMKSSHFYHISEDKQTLNITGGNSTFSLKGTYTLQP